MAIKELTGIYTLPNESILFIAVDCKMLLKKVGTLWLMECAHNLNHDLSQTEQRAPRRLDSQLVPGVLSKMSQHVLFSLSLEWHFCV